MIKLCFLDDCMIDVIKQKNAKTYMLHLAFSVHCRKWREILKINKK